MPPTSTSAGPTLATEIAGATQSGLHLSEALEAAADGTPRRRLKRALRQVAARLERGEPLDKILTHNSPLPAHVSGLLKAALATGQPGLAMTEWLMLQERTHSQWRDVMGALYYPMATLLAAYSLFVVFSFWITPELRNMVEEFGLKLPDYVQGIYWITREGASGSLIVMGILAVVLVAVRIFGGRRGWSMFMTTVPVLGSLWHWTGSSEFFRALALMLDQRMALPEALRLTGQGLSDAALARYCQSLALRVERGDSFSRALERSPELPPSTFPLVRSAERTGSLVAGLRAAADMLESRLESQASLLLTLAPPLIFLAVIGLALMMVAGFMLPLVTLIQGLT